MVNLIVIQRINDDSENRSRTRKVESLPKHRTPRPEGMISNILAPGVGDNISSGIRAIMWPESILTEEFVDMAINNDDDLQFQFKTNGHHYR